MYSQNQEMLQFDKVKIPFGQQSAVSWYPPRLAKESNLASTKFSIPKAGLKSLLSSFLFIFIFSISCQGRQKRLSFRQPDRGGGGIVGGSKEKYLFRFLLKKIRLHRKVFPKKQNFQKKIYFEIIFFFFSDCIASFSPHGSGTPMHLRPLRLASDEYL